MLVKTLADFWPSR